MASQAAKRTMLWVDPFNVKMALDPGGNIYVTGFSENSYTNLGYATIKYAPNGNQLWAARYDSTNYPNATPSALVLDHSNNIIVTGDAVTLEYASNGNLVWSAPYNAMGASVDVSNNVYITGITNGYVTVKLSPLGSNLWTAVDQGTAGGSENESLAIVVDSAGEALVAGNEIIGYSSIGPPVLVSQTVLKYNTAGGLVWRNATFAEKITYGAAIASFNLALDGQSDLYVEFGADPLGGEDTAYTTIKFSSGGSVIWSQFDPTGDGYSVSTSLALDGLGNAIVTGMNANDYPNSCYGTYKMNTNGAYIWTNLYPKVVTGVSAALAIAVDSANSVYVTGYSPGANGSNNIVTIKYGPNGNQLWLQRYVSPGGGNAVGNGIAVDQSGNVYVSGYDTLPGGGTEIIVIKYSPVTLQRQSNGNVLLQAQGSPGEIFDVEASADLETWQDLGQGTTDTNGLFQFDDTNAPLYPARFYTTVPQ
jgi:hypothetical protein